MAGAIVISGLTELRAALRAADDATPREISKQLKAGAVKVAARARELAPERSGALKASLKPFATQKKAGVRSTLPYSGVQEFGKEYRRRTRSGGSATVHMSGDTPRFAYRAVDELAPQLVEEAFDALLEILKLHGWFS